MRNQTALRLGPPHRLPADGWLGTLELPGYRAGRVVAKLDELPEVDPDHLYFDVLLLDARGRAQDSHSGPCRALSRRQSLEDRSRFVRVVAELVRHAPSRDRGLTGIAQALDFLRERGVETDRLITAAQLLDNACSERAVTQSLNRVLELSLGEEEAHHAMCEVVAGLARSPGLGPPEAAAASADGSQVRMINAGGLAAQVSYVVRTVGKARARHFLRERTDFEMVPRADMFGV